MATRRALQQAQVDLIQAGYVHPAYWAAFVLIGEAGSIKMEKADGAVPRILIGPMALLLVLISAVIYRKIKATHAAC